MKTQEDPGKNGKKALFAKIGVLAIAIVLAWQLVLPSLGVNQPAAAGSEDIVLSGNDQTKGGTWQATGWKNVFYFNCTAADVNANPGAFSVWHLVYTGDDIAKEAVRMQLIFIPGNGVFNWESSDGFSTNGGGKNPGWVVYAPAGLKINQTKSYVSANDPSGNPQFNISSYGEGKTTSPSPSTSIGASPLPSEEVKPSPSEEVEPSPSEKVEPSPSEEVEPSPSEEVEPSPSEEVEPSPSEMVEPSPSIEVTPTPDELISIPSESDPYGATFPSSSPDELIVVPRGDDPYGQVTPPPLVTASVTDPYGATTVTPSPDTAADEDGSATLTVTGEEFPIWIVISAVTLTLLGGGILIVRRNKKEHVG